MISRLKNPESSDLREEITNRVVEHGAREKRRRIGNAIRRTAKHLFAEFANGEKRRETEKEREERGDWERRKRGRAERID